MLAASLLASVRGHCMARHGPNWSWGGYGTPQGRPERAQNGLNGAQDPSPSGFDPPIWNSVPASQPNTAAVRSSPAAALHTHTCFLPPEAHGELPAPLARLGYWGLHYSFLQVLLESVR